MARGDAERRRRTAPAAGCRAPEAPVPAGPTRSARRRSRSPWPRLRSARPPAAAPRRDRTPRRARALPAAARAARSSRRAPPRSAGSRGEARHGRCGRRRRDPCRNVPFRPCPRPPPPPSASRSGRSSTRSTRSSRTSRRFGCSRCCVALVLFTCYLTLRARASFNILRAAYPTERIRFQRIWGAYFAGYGFNAVIPGARRRRRTPLPHEERDPELELSGRGRELRGGADLRRRDGIADPAVRVHAGRVPEAARLRQAERVRPLLPRSAPPVHAVRPHVPGAWQRWPGSRC